MIASQDLSQQRLLQEKNQQQKSKRRTKNESIQDRNYTCGCGKAYLSYPALYLHLKNKHNGKTPVGTQLPNSNKQNRGRPKKDEQTDKLKDDSKLEDEVDETLQQIINFLDSQGSQYVLEVPNKNDLYNSDIQSSFLEVFPKLNVFKQESQYLGIYKKIQELYSNMKLLEDSNNEDKQSSKNEKEELEQNEEDDKSYDSDDFDLKPTKCNDIFAILLTKLSRSLTCEGFKEMAYFLCLYRMTLNIIGYEAMKKVKPELEKDDNFSVIKEQEFCATQTGEHCLEVCNDFILDFLPNYLQEYPLSQKQTVFGRSENQMRNAVYMTQFFSNWLFQNQYTNSKLSITQEDNLAQN